MTAPSDTLAAAARMLGVDRVYQTLEGVFDLVDRDASGNPRIRYLTPAELAMALLGALTKMGIEWVMRPTHFLVWINHEVTMKNYTDNNPLPAILACAARVQLEREKQA